MGITEHLVIYITQSIAAGGYPVVGVLMLLESMVFPVPSEAVMPFAGFLVTDGTFSFWTVVLVSTIGSLIGSLLSYAIGRYGGRVFLQKWGKYFLLNEHHLDATDTFFKGHGAPTIFVARFIPVVRHLISIPAGVAKMNVGTFSLYTILGAGLWNMFLLYVGMILGQNWAALGPYMHYLDVGVGALLVFGAVWLVWKKGT
jgi:membrane protein DedA with SNARE-associated domain